VSAFLANKRVHVGITHENHIRHGPLIRNMLTSSRSQSISQEFLVS